MKALGIALPVVRLAIGVLFASQLPNSGADALRVNRQTTEGYIGTSDHWNDSAWRQGEGLDHRLRGHRAGTRALPLWVELFAAWRECERAVA